MINQKKVEITADDLLIMCLNDLNQVIQAYQHQTKILRSYQLDFFQESEDIKVKSMEKYNNSLENMLNEPVIQKQFSTHLKEKFLKSYEQLKEVILTNKMVLEAIKQTKEHLMSIYKKYVEENSKTKSYGYKGKIIKQTPAITFFESI